MNQRPNSINDKKPIEEKDAKSAAHGDKLEHAVESASKAGATKSPEELKGDEIME